MFCRALATEETMGKPLATMAYVDKSPTKEKVERDEGVAMFDWFI